VLRGDERERSRTERGRMDLEQMVTVAMKVTSASSSFSGP
jgi:hypothetical protein